MVGKPIIRGLRITVDQILKTLAAGVNIKELLEDCPELEREDIKVLHNDTLYRIIQRFNTLKFFL